MSVNTPAILIQRHTAIQAICLTETAAPPINQTIHHGRSSFQTWASCTHRGFMLLPACLLSGSSALIRF